MTRLSYILKLLRRSFWVIPGIMTAAAAALAIGVIWLDAGLLSQLELSWAKPLMVNAESGGRILSAIAGSMITVASLVFSMTLIALTMAASNIGPRLIERFMRDRVTQISLGLFVATFVYCLLVLRTVRGGEAAPFAPHLAINLAVLFAILSFGWLVYFIHKIAVSIQTDEVVANTGADFVRAIERYSKGDSGISESCSRGDVGPILPAGHDTDGVDVEAGAAGYIQVIDTAALFKLAERRDLTIVMLRRPGHFVLAGTPLARIHSPGRQVDDDAVDHVLKHVVMGSTRTAVQDVELLINMVVRGRRQSVVARRQRLLLGDRLRRPSLPWTRRSIAEGAARQPVLRRRGPAPRRPVSGDLRGSRRRRFQSHPPMRMAKRPGIDSDA